MVKGSRINGLAMKKAPDLSKGLAYLVAGALLQGSYFVVYGLAIAVKSLSDAIYHIGKYACFDDKVALHILSLVLN